MLVKKKLSNLTKAIKHVLLVAKHNKVECNVIANLNMGLTVNVRMQELDTIEYNQSNEITIIVYKNHHQGAVTTTSLAKDDLNRAIEKAITIARFTEIDPYIGLVDPSLLATNFIDLDLYHPSDIKSEMAIKIAKDCERVGLSYDARITNSEGATFNYSCSCNAIGNSYDFIQAYPTTNYSLGCNLIAQEHGVMQRDGDYTIARNLQDLSSIDVIGNNAGLYAISRLGAIKIVTNKSKVLFTPKIAAQFFNYLIAAIYGRNIANNSSFLINRLNHQILPKFISIIDEPFVKRGLRSGCFDIDGVATKSQYIVRQGVLSTYLLNNYFAKKLNLTPTGHGSGIHNLFIINNNFIDPDLNKIVNYRDMVGIKANNLIQDLNKMVDHRDRIAKANNLIQKMQNGLIVTETIGSGVNLVTGDYSKGACGFWVEDGKIIYPVEEITIAGNLTEMFNNIIGIGNDIDYQSNIVTGSVLIDHVTIAGV